MSARRRPSVSVFAVEDRTVQLAWRNLAPGHLRVRISADGRAVGPDTDVRVDEVGTLVIDGLPADTALRAEISGSALRAGSGTDRSGPRLAFRTLAPPPGAELVRIATLNDLHLGSRSVGPRDLDAPPDPEGSHPVRCARAALRAAEGWGADRVVIKGDLTNYARLEEWRDYAALVGGSPVPVDALPGNHDHLGAPHTTSGTLDPWEAAEVHDLSLATPVLVRDLPGLRLVLAATHLPGPDRGTLGPVRRQVIEAVADADPESAVLVALHHQLHRHVVPEGPPPGIPHRTGAAFLDELGSLRRLVVVTSGHTHRHRRWDRAGVTATQVGSTKDYPGVWAGYAVHEGGIRQVVRRLDDTECVRGTEQTRNAALGAWRWIAPGRLDSRCFVVERHRI